MKKMQDFYVLWRGWLLLMVSLFLPLSALADEVRVADSNGNELRYFFEAAGPATFTGISKYSTDADKSGRIIIADRVTDGNGVGHDVLYIGSSLSNRSNIVSVVFGSNIISVGGVDGTGDNAFYNCTKLESVTLNGKLQILGNYAFQNCRKLTSINLSELSNLTTIMKGCFYNVDLLRSIKLPASVVTIGENAFYSIDSLRTLTIPSGSKLKEIGPYAFQYNNKLQSVNLEAATQLKTLSNYCFRNCYELKSVTVPASVEEIGSDIFGSCNALETITFNAATVPDNFYRYGEKLNTVNIGAGVKRIGNSAFYYNRALRTLNINSGVSNLTIGEYAFSEDDHLNNVTLPKGVVELEKAAFSNCDSMYVFTFAKDSPIKKIPQECFYYNICLEKLELPNGVQSVESGAFGYCRSMTEIAFGTALTSLPDDYYLFSNCNKLLKVTIPGINYPFVREIWIPDNAVYYVHADLLETYRTNNFTKNRRAVAIGQRMDFAVSTSAGSQLQSKIESQGDPNNLITLKVTGPINGTDIDYIHGSLPNLTSLDLSAANIVEGGDPYHLWNVSASGNATAYSTSYHTENNVVGSFMFYKMPMLKSIKLPKVITAIGEYAFAEDRQLAVVGLSDAITTIGRYAFQYNAITEVTVPNGVTRLEEYTFYNCEKLKKVTLPNGITYIGNSCFSENYALESVNIPTKVETIGEYAFYNNYSRTTPIVLPATLKTIGYRAFMYNKLVKSISFNEGLETIRGYAFSNCNAVERITLPQSLATLEYNAFEGCDSITEFRFPKNIKEVPDGVLYHCDKLKKVVLAEGTTRLGHDAFNYCPQLSDINISTMNTLTSTGRYVFQNTGFTTMTLPNSITDMDYCAFRECKNLTSVNIPTGIDYVPYDFCDDCPKLTSVKMHDGIRVIRHNAFYGCRILPTIELNDQITDIEYNAFQYCDSLVLNRLPAAIKVIDYDAFYGTSITAVSLPEGMTKLGTSVFANCKKLSSVRLPKDLKSIPDYMFQNCSALEQIVIPDSVREIGYSAFYQTSLTSVLLPDSLEKLASYAFSRTLLRSVRIPDGIKGDQPGSYVFENCKHLKEAYLGRNQDYTTITTFTFFNGCDSLQLLRIYAGTPPKCNQYYMYYRTNCVLEVPEDAVEVYKATDVWKEFKEIKGYFDGDVLNDLDFAVLKKMYRELDGANWQNPWDLSNNHRSMGKWQGIVTVGDYITSIDLSGQGLKGELPDSLFLLPRLEKLNLSNNRIKADLTTLLANRSENTLLTEVNMMGNELTGDIYPFASKLPNLTTLDVSYNQLTAVSQPISNEKLNNRYFYRGFQFVDYRTKQVVDGAPVIEMTPGIPVAIESNTLQTYRHEYGDYKHDFSELYHHYLNKNGDWTESDWELVRNGDKLWTLYSGWYNRSLHAPKGVPVVYTHGNPWWSHLTYIIRFDWKDGDVNADQTVDVTDLQSVVNYALSDSKTDGQMFNFTTADANNDDKINVSDVVGSVDYILNYVEAPSAQTLYYYNRASASQQNILSVDGRDIVLIHPDAVAALQLTISGVTQSQLRVSDEVKSHFSVALRQQADGVRVVIWSAEGHTLMPGVHHLLTALPAGAVVTDVRLSDADACHLDVTNESDATSLSTVKSQESVGDAPVFDLSGRRLGAWDTLPEGVYVIRINGKQYKVKK